MVDVLILMVLNFLIRMINMKKIFRIFFIISFITVLSGCQKTVYVNQKGEVIENVYGTKVSDYCQMRRVCKESYERIYVDTYTDVLYYCQEASDQFGITPIMKADGTCLTYTEWKSRNEGW